MSTNHFVLYHTATGEIANVCASSLDAAMIEAEWPVPVGQALLFYGAGAIPAPLPGPAADYRVTNPGSGLAVVEKGTLGLAVSVVGGGDWLADGVSTLQVGVTGVGVGDTVRIAVAGPPGAGMAEEDGASTMTFTTSEAGTYTFRVRTINASGGSKPIRMDADAV